jgi:hypothetical protein
MFLHNADGIDTLIQEHQSPPGNYSYAYADSIVTEEQIRDDLEGANIVMIFFGFGSYCGMSCTVYEKGGDIYVNTSGHCSCYGHEGQWSPQKVTARWLLNQLDHGLVWDEDEPQKAKEAVAHLRTYAESKLN